MFKYQFFFILYLYMAGGLINIVTYGTQDIYLSGTPQISFFKIVYRRHTNFSIESVRLNFDDEIGFDIKSNLIIPPVGDLINKMYLQIDLPAIAFTRIVSQEQRNAANRQYFNAKDEYKRFSTFMQVNANAYRAALDVYNASNILYSCEMLNNIFNVFNSYQSDQYVQSCIEYFSANSPIWYISPQQFNLLLIGQSFYSTPLTCLGRLSNCTPSVACPQVDPTCPDPSCYPKDNLKKLLDDAITYCNQLNAYYENNLKLAIANQAEVVNPNFKYAWVDRLGHAILDYVDISIGAERIDRHYGDWLNVWYELTGNKHLSESYMKMIGDVPSMTTFDRSTKPAYSLFIPLQFWFNRFNGLAIPLVALQYHDVTLSVKLKKFKQCGYLENLNTYTDANHRDSVDLDELFENNKYAINMTLLVDYVYIDTLERRRFAQSSHEYLIDQLQVFELENVVQQNIQARIDFINPCKELIWVIQKQAYVINDNGFTKCRWDNYSTNKTGFGLSTEYMAMDFNGYSRISRFNGMYFNYVQPYQHHSNTPSDGINVYSFSLRPEEHQPTGSCNFSRISKSLFNLWIDPKMFIYTTNDMTDEPNAGTIEPLITDVNIRIYTTNANILRILSGIGGTAYM